MDFASLMSKELGKSKKPTSDAGSSSTKKYQRRAEIEAERQAAYEAEQKRLNEQREAQLTAKRKAEDDAAAEREAREEKRRKLAEESRKRREDQEWEEEQARRKRLGLKEKARTVCEEGDGDRVADGEEDIAEAELVVKLREIGQPVSLFGEGHAAKLRRYRALTTVVTDGPIPTTLELVEEKDMKVQAVEPVDKDARKLLYRKLASYFTMVLREYERAMDAEKEDTTASRNAYATMVQTRENLKPLFRKFEKDDVESSLLKAISEIVQALQERRYVDANDGYLQLSIGKAAWPIGVTMVGIHERSAREKLHDGQKGHVMGDEVTRKYLQSIKRCLTFAQVRWPPTDMRQLMG